MDLSYSLKYITAKNLTQFGTIDFSKCDFIDEQAKRIIHRRSDIQVGDILFSRLYAQSPIEYRFLCGHDIQSEDDEDALDYYMIGVWLVQHRKYSDWSKEKAFDLAEILEFMRVYRIRIPRYIKRTRFYRKILT